MKIKIDKELLYRCEEFCRKRMTDSMHVYMHRGEQKVRKIYEDILTGVLAEWAVYLLLKDRIEGLSEPDMTIHEKQKKSYAPDLISPLYNFHIKGQSFLSAAKYGMSSLFQQTDKLLLQPADNDVIVMCIVDKAAVDVKFIGLVKDVLAANCVSCPKIQRYGHTKYAIYLADLEAKKVPQIMLEDRSPIELPSNENPA